MNESVKRGIQIQYDEEQASGDRPPGEATGERDAREPAEQGEGAQHETMSPRDAAAYIMDMAVEMKRLAEAARLSFLAYLLRLVVEEAETQKHTKP